MELEKLHPLIRDQLIRVHLIVEVDNAIGLTNANKFLEDVFKLPLSLVDDCDYLNLNVEEHVAYPGVDLGDPKKNRYFQISSRTDQTKINDGCAAFAKKLKEDGRSKVQMRFLFLKTTTPRKSDYTTPVGLDADVITFDPSKDVLTLTDLLNTILSKDIDTIRQIHNHLSSHLSDDKNLPYVDTDTEVLRLFFITLADIAIREDVDDIARKVHESDHEKKKELLGEFWNYVLEMHKRMPVEQSQRFETVYSQISEDQKFGLANFLEHNSTKLLLKTKNPEKAFNELKQLVTEKIRPFPFSETEVEQFLLQELVFCDVFPVLEKA